jgi:hypothetical protein
MKINLSRLLGSDKDAALDRAWRHLEQGLRASRDAINTGQVLSRREIAAMQGDELRQGELWESAKDNPQPALDKGYGR